MHDERETPKLILASKWTNTAVGIEDETVGRGGGELGPGRGGCMRARKMGECGRNPWQRAALMLAGFRLQSVPPSPFSNRLVWSLGAGMVGFKKVRRRSWRESLRARRDERSSMKGSELSGWRGDGIPVGAAGLEGRGGMVVSTGAMGGMLGAARSPSGVVSGGTERVCAN